MGVDAALPVGTNPAGRSTARRSKAFMGAVSGFTLIHKATPTCRGRRDSALFIPNIRDNRDHPSRSLFFMKVLYLDCFAGITGGMAVGALCDLGVKPSTLEWELSKVDLGDFHMHFERKHRANVEGIAFGIHAGATHHDDHCHEHGHSHEHDDDHAHGHSHSHDHEHGHDHGHHHDHDHGHEHAHGEHEHHHHQEDEEHGEHEHAHAHAHEHEHEHGHSHDHGHEHEASAEEDLIAHDHEHGDEVGHAKHHRHQTHGHPEAHDSSSGGHSHGRSAHEIRELIAASDLSPFVKQHAQAIFQRVVEAESKVSGRSVDSVTLHEGNALRSIANVICVCVGLEELGVQAVHVSALNEGTGSRNGAHSQLPLPTHLTLEILKGVPVAQIDEEYELITPIGAAIVSEFGQSFGPMPQLKVQQIGYGVGEHSLKSRPHVLRAVLGETAN